MPELEVMKTYSQEDHFLSPSRRNIIVILRLIVFSIIYLITIQEHRLTDIPWFLWLVLAIFVVSEIVCLFEHRTSFFIQRVLGWIFIFDAILISLLIYFLPIKSTQLFIAYFVVIAIAAMSKSVTAAFVITLIVSTFYFFSSIYQEEFVLTEFLTRPLFFFGVSLFAGYLSEEVNRQYKEKMNMEQRFQKQTKTALQNSKEQYRQIVETAQEGIWVIDAGSKTTYANKRMAQMLGYTVDEIMGKPLFAFMDEEWQAIAHNYVERRRQGIAEQHEFKFQHKDGSDLWALLSTTPMFDEKGQYTGALFMVNDITEIKKTEKTLRETEQKFRDIFDNASDGILLTDIQNHKFYMGNKTICQMIGYQEDEITKLGMEDIYPETDLPYVIEQFNKQLREEITVAEDITVKRKDGSIFYADIGAFSITIAGRTYLAGIFRDITERKKLEEELRQVQKMEAIGNLAAGIAHDFNNLLTAIEGYAELIMMDVKKDTPLYDHLQHIINASLRASDLTRQLLLFSRKQPIRLVVLDANKIINDLLGMFQHTLGEDIAIQTKLADNLWMVRGDKGNINQVLMNLVLNARDVMPKGGRLTIMTENVTPDEAYARAGRFVRLSVEDTGKGMTKEIMSHLFEPFFTTKEPGKGTGLGLSVVYSIVKQHEGWINVSSEPGQGSIFKVYLPVMTESTPVDEETKEEPSLQELKGRGERILVVEDEPMVREFARTLLSQNGYLVFPAENIKEALDVFERERGDFHLLFSDTILPDGTGPDLADQLQTRQPKLNVLISSGYTDSKVHFNLLEEKRYQFLQKPYSVTDLLKNVRKAIKGKISEPR